MATPTPELIETRITTLLEAAGIHYVTRGYEYEGGFSQKPHVQLFWEPGTPKRRRGTTNESGETWRWVGRLVTEVIDDPRAGKGNVWDVAATIAALLGAAMDTAPGLGISETGMKIDSVEMDEASEVLPAQSEKKRSWEAVAITTEIIWTVPKGRI